MVKKLLALMPRHAFYVEPFGGGASLLLAKSPAEVETYNDVDEALVNFFRVLQGEETFARFRRLVEAMPLAHAEYDRCRAHWRVETDSVRRAYEWFITVRQSFAGSGLMGSGFGYDVFNSARGMSSTVSAWLSTVAFLPAVHARLMRVQLECRDWRPVLETHQSSEHLAYCDPPYPLSTRDANKRFDNELSDDDHRELVGKLLAYRGMVMLSTYPNEIYRALDEAGWDRVAFETFCHSQPGSMVLRDERTELVYRNQRTMERWTENA